MMAGAPRRPTGSSAQARFVQWVWDSLVLHGRSGRTTKSKVSRTSTGVFSEPIESGGSLSSGSRVKQYVLTDATNLDYFICRTLSDSGETFTFGSTDIYIAKPFHLRQTPFDRDFLNVLNLGNIGTVDEITYDVYVESWDGVTFDEVRMPMSFEYKSPTFRIATNATDADPDNWTTQNQTIIPRFVPALLDEPEGGDITDNAISPTIIYAAQCSGLGITRPDDPDLPEEEQTQVAVTLLALSDGWAWAKTS